MIPAVHAQEGLRIGLRFAPVISFPNLTDDNGNAISGTEISGRLGYSYGLMAAYGFTDNLGLYSGVHIVRKGFTRTDTYSDTLNVSGTQDANITTVEIPLALRGVSGEIGSSGIFINGLFGVSLDVRAGYRNEFTGVNPVTLEAGSGTTQNASLVNPITASFLFGGGADWYVDRVGTFNFALLFHRGLLNLNSQRNFGNEERIIVNYLSLELGYWFGA